MNLCVRSPAALTSSTMSAVDDDRFGRRTRNVWSLVKEQNPTTLRATDTRYIEHILNDNNLRFRDKLKAVKQSIRCSTKNIPRCDYISQLKQSI